MIGSRDIARMYDSAARDWDRDEPIYRSDFEARPKLVELAAGLKPNTILDIGCGEGYVTRMLARATGAQVTGVDISPKLIEIARQKERKNPAGIKYRCWDMIRELNRVERWVYDLPAATDLITAAFSTHYLGLEDHTKLFRDAARICEDIVVATLDPETHWKWLPQPKTTYEEDQGRTFLGELSGKGKRVPVAYTHRTRKRMEEDFSDAEWKINERILIPCREPGADFNFVVYLLGRDFSKRKGNRKKHGR